jgi:hypothetical protein
MRVLILSVLLLVAALALSSRELSIDAWRRAFQSWPPVATWAIIAMFVLTVPLSGGPFRPRGFVLSWLLLGWLVAVALVVAHLLAAQGLIRLPWE